MKRNRRKSTTPRRDRDLYPTPRLLVEAALAVIDRAIPRWKIADIIDPGCGPGVWGQVAREHWEWAIITGVDIHPLVPLDDTSYNRVITGNYLEHDGGPYDLVMGNPPFGKPPNTLAEPFLRHAYASLRDGGYMVQLLRLEFLASQKRYKGLWRDMRPKVVYILPERPSFTADGRTDEIEYALYYWVKGFTGDPVIKWLSWR